MSVVRGHDWEGIGEQVDAEAATFAKAALGIPENARLHALDVSTAALFVHVDRDGMAKVNATVPKRQAAEWLRKVADVWDQEWKAEEHAEQKKRRNGGTQ